MNAFDPHVAADAAPEAYRKAMAQFDLALEAPVPENVRAIAEKALTETRDVYERAKDRLESDLETLERTIDAAGQDATTPQPRDDRHCPAQCEFRLWAR